MGKLALNYVSKLRLLFVVFAIILVGNRLPRHAILLADPLAQIEQLASFRTKRAKEIILPVNLTIAGGTLSHRTKESAGYGDFGNRGQQPFRTLHENPSINKFDRTFTSHRVQANGDTLASGADDGGDFPVG